MINLTQGDVLVVVLAVGESVVIPEETFVFSALAEARGTAAASQ